MSSVTEAMANIELCSSTLLQHADEYVVRKATAEWGLPCTSLQYSNSVRLGLPRNFKKVMLEEIQPSHEMWCQGTADKFVTGLVGVLKARQACSPASLCDDAYYSRKEGAVRYAQLVPLGGASFL